MRDAFLFYRSFHESAKVLNDEDRLALYDTIIEFALNQTETETKPMVNAFFSLIKPQIQANNRRYENGKKGGRPTQTETKEEPKNNLDETKEEPKEKEKEKEKEKRREDNTQSNKTFNSDLFEELWKSYTLGFLKKQGRNGGSKSKALKSFLTLIEKYRYSDIERLVDNEMSLKFGNRDLERVLTIASITQFMEDSSHIEEVNNRPVRTDV